MLGAVFRKLKFGLFISRDRHCGMASQCRYAGNSFLLFYLFAFLLFRVSFAFSPLAFRHRLPSLHYPSCSLLYSLPLSVMRIWLISIYFVAMVGTGVVAAGTLVVWIKI